MFMGNTHICPVPGSVPEQAGWDFEQLSPVAAAPDLGTVSRRICSVLLPGTEVTLAGLEFPALPLNMGFMFPLFQAVGTSLDCHNFLDMMGSGLATSSTSSLRSHGCTSSAPWICPLQVPWMFQPELLPAFPSPCLCLLGVAGAQPGLLCWDLSLLTLEKLILEYQPGPSSLPGFIPWDCPRRSLRGQICSPGIQDNELTVLP